MAYTYVSANRHLSGNLASSHYEPRDVFWGVLSSALEAIDAGTTTVVDHAHVNYSRKHCRIPQFFSATLEIF